MFRSLIHELDWIRTGVAGDGSRVGNGSAAAALPHTDILAVSRGLRRQHFALFLEAAWLFHAQSLWSLEASSAGFPHIDGRAWGT